MDLRLGRSDGEPSYWPVLSDLSITTLLILMLFLAVNVLLTADTQRRDTALKSLEREVGGRLVSAAGDSAITIRQTGADRQRLTFPAGLLFKVCHAELGEAGRRKIEAVGQVLAHYTHYLQSVDVEGHTDTTPVTQGVGCPFRSNWELSSARATTVVRVLTDDEYVPGAKIGAIGRGEFRPVSATDLRANRRVEITLLYNADSAMARLDSLVKPAP